MSPREVREDQHGTLTGYAYGCKCDECHRAWNAKARDYTRKKTTEMLAAFAPIHEVRLWANSPRIHAPRQGPPARHPHRPLQPRAPRTALHAQGRPGDAMTCPLCGYPTTPARPVPAPGEDDVDYEPCHCPKCGWVDGDLP